LSDDQTIGGRLRMLRKELGLSQQEIADRIGLSVGGWAKSELDKAVPSGDTLLRLKAIGYNPGWILTGFGAKRMETVQAQMEAIPSAIDAELMERLHDRVAAIFHDVGQKPPARRIAREAANLYNELALVVSDMSDHELIDATLPGLALAFKRRIANAEPGTGKRSA
jgi:transcriptional regulator with XRE-family HTH domain